MAKMAKMAKIIKNHQKWGYPPKWPKSQNSAQAVSDTFSHKMKRNCTHTTQIQNIYIHTEIHRNQTIKNQIKKSNEIKKIFILIYNTKKIFKTKYTYIHTIQKKYSKKNIFKKYIHTYRKKIYKHKSKNIYIHTHSHRTNLQQNHTYIHRNQNTNIYIHTIQNIQNIYTYIQKYKYKYTHSIYRHPNIYTQYIRGQNTDPKYTPQNIHAQTGRQNTPRIVCAHSVYTPTPRFAPTFYTLINSSFGTHCRGCFWGGQIRDAKIDPQNGTH